MQFSTINSCNFEKPSWNPSKRTKENTKNNFSTLQQKNWLRVSSVIAKMFEHRIFCNNRKKRIEIVFEY
jgi:hypothetical protein